MRKLVISSCLLMGLLSAAGTAQAQGIFPLAVEVRGAFAMPQGDWNESEAIGNGFGYGLDARLQILPLISLYGGWDHYTFDMESAEGSETDASDSGLHLGGLVSLPLSAITGVSPFAFAGLVYNRTTLNASAGSASLEGESDDELGYELGAGVAFPFAPTLSLTPAVRYRTHPASFTTVGDGEGDTTVSYLSLEVGLKLGL